MEGFEGTKMKGSQHNDPFVPNKAEEEKLGENKKVLKTKTNNAGGTLGGISSGSNIVTILIKILISVL